jgi:hypothetical protein
LCSRHQRAKEDAKLSVCAKLVISFVSRTWRCASLYSPRASSKRESTSRSALGRASRTGEPESEVTLADTSRGGASLAMARGTASLGSGRGWLLLITSQPRRCGRVGHERTCCLPAQDHWRESLGQGGKYQDEETEGPAKRFPPSFRGLFPQPTGQRKRVTDQIDWTQSVHRYETLLEAIQPPITGPVFSM